MMVTTCPYVCIDLVRIGEVLKFVAIHVHTSYVNSSELHTDLTPSK